MKKFFFLVAIIISLSSLLTACGPTPPSRDANQMMTRLEEAVKTCGADWIKSGDPRIHTLIRPQKAGVWYEGQDFFTTSAEVSAWVVLDRVVVVSYDQGREWIRQVVDANGLITDLPESEKEIYLQLAHDLLDEPVIYDVVVDWKFSALNGWEVDEINCIGAVG